MKSLKETSNHNQPSKIKLDPLKLEHKSQKNSNVAWIINGKW